MERGKPSLSNQYRPTPVIVRVHRVCNANLPQNNLDFHIGSNISTEPVRFLMFSTAFICRGLFVLLHAPPCSRCIWQPFARYPDPPQYGDRKQLPWRNKPGCFRETNLPSIVRRLQRQTGRTQEECWRFVIKYGIKAEVDHRRWREEELDEARELLTKYSVEEVAKRLKRSAKALRNALQRRQLRVREIRCDCFSLESLAQVLHVRRSEIVCWIERGWLQATIPSRALPRDNDVVCSREPPPPSRSDAPFQSRSSLQTSRGWSKCGDVFPDPSLRGDPGPFRSSPIWLGIEVEDSLCAGIWLTRA